MKLALIQMAVAAGDVEGNRTRGLAMVREAALKTDVVVLPEIWTTGYALRDAGKWAEDCGGPTIAALAEISRQYGVAIVAGSIPMRQGERIYNGSAVIVNGDVVADYHKIHLFSMYGEQRFFAPGGKRSLFMIGELKAGLAVCYDLRFPELFRALARDGAEIIFLPAEWPAARIDHWRILNQARAVENQIFMCSVNCVGEHKGNLFGGRSMLIGPWGEILAEGSAEEEIVYGEIQPDAVAQARKTMQVWQDRRPEMY